MKEDPPGLLVVLAVLFEKDFLAVFAVEFLIRASAAEFDAFAVNLREVFAHPN